MNVPLKNQRKFAPPCLLITVVQVPGQFFYFYFSNRVRVDGQTLASLGITPGEYSVQWGSGENADSVTLYAGTAPTLGATITQFEFPGALQFDTLPNALAYIVEWAPHPDGPWSSSWEELQRIPATEAESVTVSVPMFFRATSIGFDP